MGQGWLSDNPCLLRSDLIRPRAALAAVKPASRRRQRWPRLTPAACCAVPILRAGWRSEPTFGKPIAIAIPQPASDPNHRNSPDVIPHSLHLPLTATWLGVRSTVKAIFLALSVVRVLRD